MKTTLLFLLFYTSIIAQDYQQDWEQVKKLEEKQQKETIAKYKNVDSGAALADILGPALKAEKKPKKSKKEE